jgi:hypothetical protein
MTQDKHDRRPQVDGAKLNGGKFSGVHDIAWHTKDE